MAFKDSIKVFLDANNISSLKTALGFLKYGFENICLLNSPGIESAILDAAKLGSLYKIVYVNCDKVRPSMLEVEALASLCDENFPVVHALTFDPTDHYFQFTNEPVHHAYLRHLASHQSHHQVKTPFSSSFFAFDQFSLLKMLDNNVHPCECFHGLDTFLTFEVTPTSLIEKWIVPNFNPKPNPSVIYENELRISGLENEVKAYKRLLEEKEGSVV